MGWIAESYVVQRIVDAVYYPRVDPVAAVVVWGAVIFFVCLLAFVAGLEIAGLFRAAVRIVQ